MEEKHLMQTTPKPMPPMRRGPSSRLVRITAVAFFIGLYLLACYYIDPRGVFHKEPDFDEFEEELPKKSTPVKSQTLVPLEAHIMSKCPDARDCLRDLVLPTMVRVHDKVNFTLSFIGTPTDNDGVACKHGPEECLGNIIELCAQKLYPEPKAFLGFTMCLTRDYKHIPQRSLIEDCALEHALDFNALNECATRENGAYGVGMLRDSVQRTANAGVTKSCTVRLDNKIYCIRDGGKWTDCPHGASPNDLVIEIEKLHRARSSGEPASSA